MKKIHIFTIEKEAQRKRIKFSPKYSIKSLLRVPTFCYLRLPHSNKDLHLESFYACPFGTHGRNL
jgi:hypothetical protein